MRAPLLFSSFMLVTACAPTAHERVGDVARYAPAYAGYVLGQGQAKPIVLRDPVTFEKIQCREDLERVAPTVAEVVAAEVHDEHWRTAAPAAVAPLSAAGYASFHMGIGLLTPELGIFAAATSPSSRAVYERASAAFVAGSHQDARDRFLTILLGQTGIEPLPRPWREISLYYLALSDQALHREHEAASAFDRFLRTSSLEDEARYRDAESRLRALDPGRLPACASRADFTLTWPGAS